MANYSDIFPLTTTVTTANLEALIWESKTADFTAIAGKGYICSPSAMLTITLPSNPQVNDTVGFLLKSGEKVLFTSTDKINGSVPASGYGKEVNQKYLMVKLTYSGATNGWVWDSLYNSYIKEGYAGSAKLLPYTSTSNLNGMVDWIGTSKGTQAFSSPANSFTMVGKTSTVGNTDPTFNNGYLIMDKATSSGATITNPGLTNTSSDVGPLITFPAGMTLIPTVIAFHINATSPWTAFLEGQKTDGTFETIGSVYATTNSTEWRLFTYSGSSEFKALYLHGVYFYYANTREFEAWGTFFG